MPPRRLRLALIVILTEGLSKSDSSDRDVIPLLQTAWPQGAMVCVIGFEGSANKISVGIIRDGEVGLLDTII